MPCNIHISFENANVMFPTQFCPDIFPTPRYSLLQWIYKKNSALFRKAQISK